MRLEPQEAMRADHIVLLVVLVDDFAGGLHPTVLPSGLRAGSTQR